MQLHHRMQVTAAEADSSISTGVSLSVSVTADEFVDSLHLFAIDNFLSSDDLRDVMDVAPSTNAAVSRRGGVDYGVDEALRRTRRVSVSEDVERDFVARLDSVREAAAAHFNISVREVETPQFLAYRVGDFFVRHADRDRAGLNRRAVSVIVFVNDDYEGGGLKFIGEDVAITITPTAGQLIAFRSDALHEVEPVTKGLRFTVVSWFLA